MSDTPDFDSMTPEQIMAWMESLAKRQGADERGFLTSADMDVPEVDESAVDVASLGEYIPHGWTKERWEEQKKKDEAERAARKAARSASPTPPAPPAPAPTPPPTAIPAQPELELPALDEVDEDESTVIAPADSLSWLEELAGGGQGDMPDLSALDAISEPLAIPDLPTGDDSGDPLAWLEGLAGGETDAPALTTDAPVSSPIDSGDDPLVWLETLAKRQDASEEELTTSADLDIPMPAAISDDGPGYKDYSFESPSSPAAPTSAFPAGLLEDDEEEAVPELNLEDPEAWLDQLASGGAPVPDVEEDLDDDEEADAEVIQRMREGTLSPEDVEGWFNRAFEKAERIPDVEESDDGDSPAVPADLPDWLMEQVQVDPPPPPAQPDEKLLAAIESPPSGAMPDWLGEGGAPGDMSDIFDDGGLTPLATEELLAESNDTWVEAFHLESQMNPEEVPDWYRERLEAEGYHVDEVDEVEAVAELPPTPAEPPAKAPTTLETVSLPVETELQAGEPENLPDWLAEVENIEVASAPSAAAFLDARDVMEAEAVPDWLASSDEASAGGDMNWLTDDLSTPAPTEALPDWLADTNVEPTEIPDWLLDTLDEGAPAVPAPSAPPTVAFTPSPTPAPAPPPPVSPAPVPTAARNIDVAATLQSARAKISGGDIDGALTDYEAIVRANSQLEAVSADLEKLLADERHKKNPAPYRVLGDSLMRQGKLQAALDTYRKALNLL